MGCLKRRWSVRRERRGCGCRSGGFRSAARDNEVGLFAGGAKSYVKRLRSERGSVRYVVIIGAPVLFLWSERLRRILTKRIGLRYV